MVIRINNTDNDQFTCSMCEETLYKEWSDEEALAEKNKMFKGVPIENCVLICDTCYNEFINGKNNKGGNLT